MRIFSSETAEQHCTWLRTSLDRLEWLSKNCGLDESLTPDKLYGKKKKKMNNYHCIFWWQRKKITVCCKVIKVCTKKYILNIFQIHIKTCGSLSFLITAHNKILSFLQQNHQKQMPTSCFSKAFMLSSSLHGVWTLFHDFKIQGGYH